MLQATDSASQPEAELIQSLLIVEIGEETVMAQIKGNIVFGLGDRDDMLTQRMSDTSFVKDIGIAACEVADDNVGAEDQLEDVLDEYRVRPDVIGS